jgi:hypothetical protein
MERRLAEVGAAIRRMGVTMTVTYGTGGYCVMLTDKNRERFAGYSWDIDEAFLLAQGRYEADKENIWDEDTQVDHRAPNVK